nr:uncharacterized protein LOC106677777 isoform X3 [Halyomorpha halys]
MSTLATILKNKKKFEDGSLQSLKYKKLKAVRFKDLEESLLSWLKEWPDKDAPMGGTVIQEKAHQFAEQFGYENFRASNGWLESFKKRNELIFRKLWGRSTSVNDGFFKEEETFELSKPPSQQETWTPPIIEQPTPPPLKKLKQSPKDTAEELLGLATEYLNKPESEWEVMAKGWALKLSKLATDQRLFAEKIINDTLFEAQMGTLTRNGVRFLTASDSDSCRSSSKNEKFL